MLNFLMNELSGIFALAASVMAVVVIRVGLYRRELPAPKKDRYHGNHKQ